MDGDQASIQSEEEESAIQRERESSHLAFEVVGLI